MSWHWSAHWTVDPDSVSMWALGVALVLTALLILAALVVSLIGWWLDEPGPAASHQPRTEVARLGEYRSAIDEVYDRAEQEVHRVIERGDGG